MSSDSESKSTSRKTWVGKVVSDKMDKTVVVLVQTKVKHRMYKKYVQRHKKFYVHDAENDCHIGDQVMIEECRPLSRSKRWVIREIQSRGVG